MYFYERTKKTYTQTACKLVLHHHNKPKISQSLLYHQLTEFPLWQVTNRTFICNVSTYWYSIRIFSSDFLTLSPSSIKTVLFFVLPLHLACELIKNYLGNSEMLGSFGKFTVQLKLTTHILLRNYNQSSCNGVFLRIVISMNFRDCVVLLYIHISR